MKTMNLRVRFKDQEITEQDIRMLQFAVGRSDIDKKHKPILDAIMSVIVVKMMKEEK